MAIGLTLDDSPSAERAATPWAAVTCLSLLTFLLVGLEFMPVSLLTPIASDLAISEGQAGQAIAVSGLFAVLTSLFGNALLARARPENGRPALHGGAGRLEPDRCSCTELPRVPDRTGIGRNRHRRLLVPVDSHPGTPGVRARPPQGHCPAPGRHCVRTRDRCTGWQLPRRVDRMARHLPRHGPDRALGVRLADCGPAEDAGDADRLRVQHLRPRASSVVRPWNGRNRFRLHRPELALDLPSSLPRERDRPFRERAVDGPSRRRRGRPGRTVDRRLCPPEKPHSRADRTACHTRDPGPPADWPRAVRRSHGCPTDPLGALHDPDSGGLEYLDDQGHSRRPRGRRGLAGRPHSDRHRRGCFRGRCAVRHGRLVERVPAGRRPAYGLGRTRIAGRTSHPNPCNQD